MSINYFKNLWKRPRGHEIDFPPLIPENDTTENVELINEPFGVDDWKLYFPQTLVTIAVNLMIFLLGFTYWFPMVISPAFTTENKTSNPFKCFTIDTDKASFHFSFMYFFQAIGSIVSGFALEMFGSWWIFLGINYPMLLGWVFLFSCTIKWQLILALALMSVYSGCLEGAVLTYVSEISMPHTRNTLIAHSNVFKTLGMLVGSILATWMSWKEMVAVAAVVQALAALTFSYAPESPLRLLVMGKKKQAETALCWLRGGVAPAAVMEEYKHLSKFVTATTSLSHADYNHTFETGEELSTDSFVATLVRGYSWRKTLRSAWYSTLLFFVSTSTVYAASMSHMYSIAEDLEMLLSPCSVPLLFNFASFLGALSCLLTVHKFGRRLIMILSLGGVSIVSYMLINFKQELAMICFLVIIFFSNYGLQGPIMSIMIEYLPVTGKGINIGICIAINYIYNMNAMVMFYFIKQYMDIHHLFVVYGTINAVNIYILHKIVPEWENICLTKIGNRILY